MQANGSLGLAIELWVDGGFLGWLLDFLVVGESYEL